MKKTIYHNSSIFDKRILWFSFLVCLLGSFTNIQAQSAQADSLHQLGRDFYGEADYDQSIKYFQLSADAYLQIGDSLNWTNSLLRKSDAMINRGRPREALDLLLQLNDDLPSNITPVLVAKTHKNLGRTYRELELYDEAILHYKKGIEYAEASGDSSTIALLNNNISYPYLYSGDYDKAISYQQKAKNMYEALGNDFALSFVLNGIFLTLRDLNLHEQANTYIRKSMQLREDIDNPNLKDITYHNMALNYSDLGKRDSAIIFYQKSLELSRLLENPYEITQTLNNIGVMYERSGDYDNALAYYNEALEVNYQTERPVSIAKNLMQLADVAILSNDLGNAEAFYTEALNWMEQANSPRTLSTLYLDFAKLEISKQNFENADSYIREALIIAKETGIIAPQIRAHTLLGEIHEVNGDTENSLSEYRKAYKLSKSGTLPNRIFPAIELSRAYHRSSSDSAYFFAVEAFSHIDSIRTNVAGLAFRSGYFSQYANFYNEVASWYIKDNNAERAYNLVESAKARVLMDELAEAENKFFQQLDEATLIKKQQMSKKIDQLHNQIYETQDKDELRSLNDELKDLEFEYQSFINEIRYSIPEWKNFEYPEPLTAEQVRDYIPDETALLEFAYANQHLLIFLISSTDIQSFIIEDIEGNQTKDHLTELVSSFRDQIITKKPVNELNSFSEVLHKVLIETPLSASDEILNNLVIIPEGNLTFLPFEALYTGDGYLVEELNIKYLPSASIYPFIQAPHRPTNNDLLAIAGSGFTETAPETELSSQDSYASLPSTLIEVESIIKNFEAAKVLKNEDVTEAGLKAHDLSQFRFIHFATHGNIDELNPSQSGLILSTNSDTESLFGEDGFLNITEISELTLNADLVTLSACNTGMGKVITGEGLIGLQRSFLSAGASSVMVSLWNIYDRSTAEFMSEFYTLMMDHRDADYGIISQGLNWIGFYKHPLFDYKAKAMRDTKLTMISHPYYSHPVHWAPFILIGK